MRNLLISNSVQEDFSPVSPEKQVNRGRNDRAGFINFLVTLYYKEPKCKSPDFCPFKNKIIIAKRISLHKNPVRDGM